MIYTKLRKYLYTNNTAQKGENFSYNWWKFFLKKSDKEMLLNKKIVHGLNHIFEDSKVKKLLVRYIIICVVVILLGDAA